MSKKTKKQIFFAVISVIIICLYAWGFAIQSVSYKVRTDKPCKGLKIVFISDLHNCFFGGSDQSKIIDEVDAANPDIVLFGGDVIDAWGGTKHAFTLMKSLSEKYPCFYSPGNHEEIRDDTGQFYDEVRRICPVLTGNYEDITVNGMNIRIFGSIDAVEWADKASQLDCCFDSVDEDSYNILLAHQPEHIDSYLGKDRKTDKHFDLVLSGHAHGGQWRIPGILEQGLYAPDQGLFPEYTSGMYEYDDTVHIISRGLAKPLRMIFIPRIFNRPELSVIEITG